MLQALVHLLADALVPLPRLCLLVQQRLQDLADPPAQPGPTPHENAIHIQLPAQYAQRHARRYCVEAGELARLRLLPLLALAFVPFLLRAGALARVVLFLLLASRQLRHEDREVLAQHAEVHERLLQEAYVLRAADNAERTHDGRRGRGSEAGHDSRTDGPTDNI